MLSKNKIKYILSLKSKKHRVNEGCFIAEGTKVIHELLHSNFNLKALYSSIPLNNNASFDSFENKCLITETELKKISGLVSPNKTLAIFDIPQPKPIRPNNLIVALDAIRDPGNLGTIIRLCDWFGISDLVCSHGTVDAFNPKVIQASMGSIARINMSYLDLPDFLNKTSLPVFGAFMSGETVYQNKLPDQGILVLGNEANGISETVENLINKRLSIPRFGNLKKTESLNVATAAAILLSEFRRNF